MYVHALFKAIKIQIPDTKIKIWNLIKKYQRPKMKNDA